MKMASPFPKVPFFCFFKDFKDFFERKTYLHSFQGREVSFQGQSAEDGSFRRDLRCANQNISNASAQKCLKCT